MKNSILIFITANLLFTSCSNLSENDNSTSQTEVSVETFTLDNPPIIGEYENVLFREGGFSGMYYIPGTDNEFYLINDRGPNIPANNSTHANGKQVKIFPFPDYSQKLVRVKLENDNVKILCVKSLLFDVNTSLSGMPIFSQDTLYQEYAWKNTSANSLPLSNNGADIEALVFQNDSIFWFAEEYRPSIWKMNLNTMQKVEFFSPDNGGLPQILNKRQPNRGFEGIAFDNKETIYAMLQSPLWNPNPAVGKTSRLTRIVTLNVQTGNTNMFMYEMNPPIGDVRSKDWKIGDIVFIGDNKLLVLEHGSRGTDFFADVFIVDISEGGVINEEMDSKFALEKFETKENLALETGIRVVGKKHLVNLKELGLDLDLGKLEGISFINDSTIAIVNDNDYSIEPINDTGEFKENNILTKILVIKNLRIK
jgi:hypothetical protein